MLECSSIDCKRTWSWACRGNWIKNGIYSANKLSQNALSPRALSNDCKRNKRCDFETAAAVRIIRLSGDACCKKGAKQLNKTETSLICCCYSFTQEVHESGSGTEKISDSDGSFLRCVCTQAWATLVCHSAQCTDLFSFSPEPQYWKSDNLFKLQQKENVIHSRPA